ncbi:MAG: hypothetical protein ACLPQS_07325 [Acidimicrobiales bacterium]
MSGSPRDDSPALTIAEAAQNRQLFSNGRVMAIHVLRTRDPRVGHPAHLRCEIELDDGTGQIWLSFAGRAALPGVEIGTHLAVSGLVSEEEGQLVVVDPLYHIEFPDPDEPQPE